MKLLCNIMGHRRDHGQVRRVGHAFVAQCKNCDAPMIRPTIDAEWRLRDPAIDDLAAAAVSRERRRA